MWHVLMLLVVSRWLLKCYAQEGERGVGAARTGWGVHLSLDDTSYVPLKLANLAHCSAHRSMYGRQIPYVCNLIQLQMLI